MASLLSVYLIKLFSFSQPFELLHPHFKDFCALTKRTVEATKQVEWPNLYFKISFKFENFWGGVVLDKTSASVFFSHMLLLVKQLLALLDFLLIRRQPQEGCEVFVLVSIAPCKINFLSVTLIKNFLFLSTFPYYATSYRNITLQKYW